MFDPEKINSYHKHLRNPDNYDDNLNQCEYDIKEFLSKLGNIKKIPKNNDQDSVVDFEIEDKNIFIEVKSINIVYLKSINESSIKINVKDETEWLEKINLTLKDIEKKRSTLTNKSSIYLGAICFDAVQYLNSRYLVFDLGFIKKTNFNISNIDALLLYPPTLSNNNDTHVPILFSKIKFLTDLFNRHYGKELTVMTF